VESFGAQRWGRWSHSTENLGRELFTVDFDSGQRVVLFAHEIELEGECP